MVLVDHQIESRLLPIPTPRSQNRSALSTATHQANSIDLIIELCTWEIIGEPNNLVAASSQFRKVGQGNTLSPTRQRIDRIAPI